MSVIKIRWTVEEITNVISQFDVQKIYRSITGENGSYIEITNSSTRIPLENDKSDYYYDDLDGNSTYWYKIAYYNSLSDLESNASVPRVGNFLSALSIISVEELKEIYLFGLDLTNDAGEPYPNSLYEHYILSAFATLERRLDIHILPYEIVDEKHDYYNTDIEQFMFLLLNEYPVISVEAVRMEFPNGNVLMNVPINYIHLNEGSGQVQIIPTLGPSIPISMNNVFYPYVSRYFTRTVRNLPDFFRISYTAGLSRVPENIKDLIGKIASFGPLNIGGDLLGGAGIATASISVDGLSQTYGTTSSATNAGYGARLLQYSREIKELIPELRRYYKGIRVRVI